MRIGPVTSIARDPRNNRLVVVTLGDPCAVRPMTGHDLARGRLLSQLDSELAARGLHPSAPLRVGGVVAQRGDAEDGLWGVFVGAVELDPEDGDLMDQLAALDMSAVA